MWSTDGGIHEIPLPDVRGRLWLCGKHHIGPDVEAVLSTVGATTVVCLTQRHELAERFPTYVEWLDAERGAGGRAVWRPIPDLWAPPIDEVRPFLDDLVARLRAGDGLVVHCAAGIGRAGTTAVAILVLLGVPASAAIDTVRSHRPLAGPESGPQTALISALASSQGQAR